ncbi:MAG TPA: patatin-like phospholipase family protein, partial [Accumulibacter sp.]|nr:patatin-like phospholipase family protein [Accumulibacter sp.]
MQRRERPTVALVLMGGGARTAYQVGVLRALVELLRASPGQHSPRG